MKGSRQTLHFQLPSEFIQTNSLIFLATGWTKIKNNVRSCLHYLVVSSCLYYVSSHSLPLLLIIPSLISYLFFRVGFASFSLIWIIFIKLNLKKLIAHKNRKKKIHVEFLTYNALYMYILFMSKLFLIWFNLPVYSFKKSWIEDSLTSRILIRVVRGEYLLHTFTDK